MQVKMGLQTIFMMKKKGGNNLIILYI